ncbi:MAG: DUF1232 domain-containing protein [Euryarchaeota archaeon]|nr:DUF1232 domain-containing protein [Euryarchaeota archaeon]
MAKDEAAKDGETDKDAIKVELGKGEDDFYQRLRKKVIKWARSKEGRESRWSDYVLVAPDLFHLLCRLALDRDVPMREKAKLAGAIAYFISPIDILPEALVGPIGLLDDIALAAYVLNSIITATDPKTVQRHWAGDQDILVLVKGILDRADEMIGRGVIDKLARLTGSGKDKEVEVEGKVKDDSKVVKPDVKEG